MKVVVLDDGGLIGVETALWVRDHGHEVGLVSAPGGLDLLTRDEIAEAVQGCSVVIDLCHQPSLAMGALDEERGFAMDEERLVEAWLCSTSDLMRAEAAAGVTHHVVLSVVGADRVASTGAFRALQAHEAMIRRSGVPHTIVRATQLFESAEDIADAGTEDWIIWVPPVDVRPVSSRDVAMLVAHCAVSRPLNGVREIAGPEEFRLDVFIREALTVGDECRRVFTDVRSPFFGAHLRPSDLLPGAGAFITETRFRDWFAGCSAPEITS
ncbi:uncharacterized protein YbjT (DUF2867 family) [Streptomyces sp. 840.1]|uniref:SDR family oxidoreductase n=1 Tax=Streptomyces sp. 840.1 TaxID=2485152 RepID=UPI000F462F67|nr:SDR family oxidoreductase [Streptomyces sp. 840.1]ROQ60116.1 uncharacterized protein YbjT (DUF2867 family) [Streptomyces sp. 840.1]